MQDRVKSCIPEYIKFNRKGRLREAEMIMKLMKFAR